MVSEELLTASGTIRIVSYLAENSESTVSQIVDSDTVKVSGSTVRNRLNSLEQEGYVVLGAKVVNSEANGERQPKRVYSLTEEGQNLHENHLDTIVDYN